RLCEPPREGAGPAGPGARRSASRRPACARASAHGERTARGWRAQRDLGPAGGRAVAPPPSPAARGPGRRDDRGASLPARGGPRDRARRSGEPGGALLRRPVLRRARPALRERVQPPGRAARRRAGPRSSARRVPARLAGRRAGGLRLSQADREERGLPQADVGRRLRARARRRAAHARGARGAGARARVPNPAPRDEPGLARGDRALPWRWLPRSGAIQRRAVRPPLVREASRPSDRPSPGGSGVTSWDMVGGSLAHHAVLDTIGAGGMGVVYPARDEKLHREVALKVLPPHRVQDPVARSRLLNEARAASALNHPNICTVYEVGEAEGQSYIAMEAIDGKPLSTLLGTRALPTETVLHFGIQVAAALAHAHERGILHRDLKASNVMVTPLDQVKVLDFGLGKRIAERSDERPTAEHADAMTTLTR